jgi:hypothetical protein
LSLADFIARLRDADSAAADCSNAFQMRLADSGQQRVEYTLGRRLELVEGIGPS